MWSPRLSSRNECANLQCKCSSKQHATPSCSPSPGSIQFSALADAGRPLCADTPRSPCPSRRSTTTHCPFCGPVGAQNTQLPLVARILHLATRLVGRDNVSLSHLQHRAQRSGPPRPVRAPYKEPRRVGSRPAAQRLRLRHRSSRRVQSQGWPARVSRQGYPSRSRVRQGGAQESVYIVI